MCLVSVSLPGGLLQRHGLPGGCEQEALGCTSHGQVFLISSMLGHLGRPISLSDLMKKICALCIIPARSS